jgi:hypothetical protein
VALTFGSGSLSTALPRLVFDGREPKVLTDQTPVDTRQNHIAKLGLHLRFWPMT